MHLRIGSEPNSEEVDMRNVLSGCSKAIAAILTIVFVITTLVVLMLFNIERGLLQADIFKDAMAEQGFYDQLPGLLADQLQGSMTYNPCENDPTQCEGEGPPGEGEGGPPDIMTNLTTEDWERLLGGLIPPSWLQTQVESVLDQAFAFLETGNTEPGVLISMVTLKAHIAGEEGLQAILGVIQSKPPCTEEQLNQLGQFGGDMTELISVLLTCSPPQELIDEFLPEIRPILEEVVAGIKDEVNLLDSLGGMLAGEGDGGFDLEILGLIRLAIRLSPLLPLALLLLVTLFGVRSLKGFLRWWGIPLLIVGVIAVVGAAMIPLLLNWAIVTYGSSLTTGLITPEVINLAIEMVSNVIGSLALAILIQAAILALLGLVFSIVSFFVKKRQPVDVMTAV